MKRQTRTSEISCPFFKQRRDNTILCECLKKDCKLKLEFKSNAGALSYMKDYCGSLRGCQGCLIHKALWMKYEEDRRTDDV